MTLHQRPSEGDEESDARRLVRVFILGARAESSLPPHIWQQLPYLFPGCRFHLFFIGPQVAYPPKIPGKSGANDSPLEKPDANEVKEARPPNSSTSSGGATKAISYNPPTPSPNLGIARARPAEHHYGVPSYTVSYSASLSLTFLQAPYADVHAQFGPFDPYQDVFFAFSPGFGFPSPVSPEMTQIVSPTEWGPTVPLILSTKCALFVTGFSPTDMERDVRSLEWAPEVSGEFDWVLTPGVNPFGSEKWEVADFDPRVMVKVNWGVWGIRGKRREVEEVRGLA
jgi:splicing suppressor protein 51